MEEMTITALGLIASLLSTLSLMPQVIRFRHGYSVTRRQRVETRSLPTLTHCFPPSYASPARTLLCRSSHSLHSSRLRMTLSVDYFVAGFFSSTRMTSIGPLPMFSGRCAPAGEKTASPFFPDTSSLLPSG